MFSGIVQDVGTVKEVEFKNNILEITISSKNLADDVYVGDSIAVDGCCLTVIEKAISNQPSAISHFKVQLTQETLSKTNFSKLEIGSKINLELPLEFGEKVSGHLVTGHVDATGEIISVNVDGDSAFVEVNYPIKLRSYIAPKGSIAVNGVSLTVVNRDNTHFSFALIPYTRDNTNLDFLKTGDLVNLEVDLISRYLVNFLECRESQWSRI